MAEHAMYFTDDRAQRMYKIRKGVMNFFVYLFLSVFALFMLAPFVIMVIGSFINADAFENFSLTANFENLGFANWTIDNYSFILLNRQFSNFPVYFLNTLIVAVGGTTVTVVTAVLAAFAFARLQFKGKDALFALLLATMMIPGEMMVISNYLTVSAFGWIKDQTLLEAYLCMIVPFWISVFYIYLLRQNFKQIPNELYLAAKVDGKSDWSFLWKVMVPLAAPTLISITILKFMGTWNSYVWPALVTKKDAYRLISNGLRGSAFVDIDTGEVEYGYQMAASFCVTVPLFLLFVFFRKYIMRGVGRAGIKG